MTRTRIVAAGLAVALAVGLYLIPLPTRGLLGPDEPRYASIAREMAESGDLVTPRLWGEPWFEKPVMLFWLGAGGHVAGIGAYTRLPVVLLCLAFLGFFWHRVRREYGSQTAFDATGILATCGGWVGFSDAGVFDAPLTVFVSAALLCLLPWARNPERSANGAISSFGALLGLAVLTKGLVAPVIAAFAVLPVVLARPRRALALLGVRALLPFLGVCLPWYVACYVTNGPVFIEEFIVRHHWDRFLSSSLQHVQPWWFYGPVLVMLLLPWSPLLVSLRRDALWAHSQRRFLTCWAAGQIVFFSVAVNKLPAYVLPALPPLAILMAVRWTSAPARRLLVVVACILVLVPLAGAILPPALADGVIRAWQGLDPGQAMQGVLVGVALAAVACLAALRVRRTWAIPAISGVVALALMVVKFQAYPAASEAAGTREFFARNQSRLQEACVGQVRRHTDYGIRHYGRNLIPLCTTEPRKFRIEGDPPRLLPNEAVSPSGNAREPR